MKMFLISIALTGFLFSCKNKENIDASNLKIENKYEINFCDKGDLSSLIIYIDDCNETVYRFFSNGMIDLVYSYCDSLMIGSAYSYYESGGLAFYGFFDKSGLLRYKRLYYEHGEVKEEEGVLIIVEYDEMILENDSLYIPIYIPHLPGSCVLAHAFLYDENENCLDTLVFHKHIINLKVNAKIVQSIELDVQMTVGEIIIKHGKTLFID
ncbi:hypothetical protein [Natronoflexus pectinivorans]|uniref:MORN repeat protein n=1 Tax=Natronoflexus pectinivorans TaxID=682526 RepID=A0A4R2GMK2_9BACT|nr:hypothetical protein [Natronoflexus pectinivorans]TCO10514.1 hypothetical protein EV194_101144 [Natronoflexus pectinivorans]